VVKLQSDVKAVEQLSSKMLQ